MEFKVGDYIECKPNCFREYAYTTEKWIGKITSMKRVYLAAETIRTRKEEVLIGGHTYSDLTINDFRKVSDFKLAMFKNREKLK